VNPAEIERYLHEHIPLSAAMQVRVLGAGDGGIRLEAPLAPNINHRETAFGGSIASLAVLAGWARVHFGLREEGIAARVVVQNHDVAYLLPIDAVFQAEVEPMDPAVWNRFVATLKRHRKARIQFSVNVLCAGSVASSSRATFVALTA
jgi:thioesterase domain-containing protein